jgi:HSP20 family molecular chaperone IbpA
MQVDIQDKDTEIVIKADTPGLTGADLTVCSAVQHHQ